MALPDRDVERLDHALDAHLTGQLASEQKAEMPLLDTFARLRAMNDRVESDETLKNQLWRSMMAKQSLVPVVQIEGSIRSERASSREFTFVKGEDRRLHRGAWLEPLVAILLVVVVIGGLLGVREHRSSTNTTLQLAQTVPLIPSDVPVASDCTSTARDPGTVEQLAGTKPEVSPALPRYGNDPIFDETAATGTSDGSTLISNSVAINGTVDGVSELFDQLLACRYYAYGTDGKLDLDSRYLALFSNDFFRRELAGYKEAGKDIKLVSYWRPSTVPVVVETRLYGDRLLLILQRWNDQMDTFPVLMLARSINGWQVDEIGNAAMPEEWITPDKLVAPSVKEVMGRPRMDIALNDIAPESAGVSVDNVCSPQANGAPTPCGQGFDLLGPYNYSDYPANTDFTISLSNIGSEVRHFRIDALDIAVDVEPGASATFILSAPAGTYLFEVYAGSDESPIGAGTLNFVDAGTPRSVG